MELARYRKVSGFFLPADGGNAVFSMRFFLPAFAVQVNQFSESSDIFMADLALATVIK
ncbi:MAG: hypothetical protein V4634_03080 [Pseudomonadota bacterium]